MDALVAAIASVMPDTVQVLDGHPGGTKDLADDVVYVAAGGLDGPSVEVTQTHDDALCDPTETGLVRCGLSSWRGDIDMEAVRDRAASLLGDVEDLIRADRKLGVDVDWCELGDRMVWALAHSSEGSVAVVTNESNTCSLPD